MTKENRTKETNLYSLLPSLNDLLLTGDFALLLETVPRSLVVSTARTVLADLKREIAGGAHDEESLRKELATLHLAVARQLEHSSSYRLRRVLNATGVVLHTNLGRAPLSASALARIVETAGGYSNLELDLETGARSRRDVIVEELLLRVAAGQSAPSAGASAIVVNNCAAATFLALNTLAEGGEVIVSRGELVEIGGGFRIPEILAKSGAVLREVGTTNRTRIADYKEAIGPSTRLLLRVHTSNFAMQGFVQQPALADLVALARQTRIPLFYDQGTGLLRAEPAGLGAEPTLPGALRHGCDLVAASGDKLLGGPQCGLLLGTRELVQRIRKNPLYRTYRVDKLTYAALEATLLDYASERASEIPTQRMLALAAADIFSRCESISREIDGPGLAAEAVPVQSLAGGGTAPAATLASAAISLRHTHLQPQQLLSALRRLDPPVIGRIQEDQVLLDLRTVEQECDATLTALLRQMAAESMGSEGENL
jgi:L-seryl-tRNA(Ser) seleniumtransferase